MNRFYIRSLAAAFFGASIPLTFAQFPPETARDCIDPMNMMPFSTPFIVHGINNDLMRFDIGITGTVTYGGQSGPCFNPAVTVQTAGKFAFQYGASGSIQQSPSGFDDAFLSLVFGAGLAEPAPSWTYAAISEDGTRTRYGAGGLPIAFVGFSNRYQRTEATVGNVRVRLQCEVVADAARLRWTLTNLDGTTAHNIGLFFGGAVSISDINDTYSHINLPLFNAVPGYVYTDKNRPPVTDAFYDRNLSPINFPDYVDFVFSQSDYYGFRIENTPSASTDDTVEANKPATADRFWIGKITPALNPNGLLGPIDSNDANFPLQQIPDTLYLGATCFVQEFPEISVQPGGSRTILHYVRSTWGRSDYKLPFGVVVDAPTTIGLPQSLGGNTLFQNPFPIRVYVDNVGGFAFDGKEFELNEVRIKLQFPADAGVTISGSSPETPHVLERTINRVDPREDEFVNFQASVGPNVSGTVPFKVIVDAQPGSVHKEINGEINVASRPRLEIFPDANMLTLPYNFVDTALESIFQPWMDPNVPGGDMQFYKFDATQKGYVITTTAERGKSFWVIYDKTGASSVIANYGGAPSQPDLNFAQALNLKPGFNMIGNPHNYYIPITLINGVSAGANQISRTFQEMVDLGYVQSFLSYWDPELKDYVFVPAADGKLEPHQGYWINVLTADDLSINYPPVFAPFVPDTTRQSGRSAAPGQTDGDWALKIVGRTRDAVDSDNSIGVAKSKLDVNRRQAGEPPMSPVQQIQVGIQQVVGGKEQLMARAFTETKGRSEWKVQVTSKKAGDVTLTWPNLSQIPKNVRLTLVDSASNIRRQVRQTSGYTFRMDKPGTRELTIISEAGGSSNPVIGNVIATRGAGGKAAAAPSTPFTISYTLGSDATTTVRVLSAKGQEVYVISRGRADRAGENTVTWNLRNSANQAVAPGTYRVEIIAESETGERVRRAIPINVIR